MSAPAQSGALLRLLGDAANVYVQARFSREPLSFGWATVTVERVQILPDEIVAHLFARGPMNISARARAVVAVESVGSERATLRLGVQSDNRTIGQVLESFVPRFAPRLEDMLRERGIAGVSVEGERIVIDYRPFVSSLLAGAV